MALTVEQQEMLRARFVHADLPFCECLFHPDQPAGGQMPVGGVMYPAVLMASNVAWFANREHRPDMPKAREDGTFAKMKTKASKGLRHLLVDDTGAQELLIVEGEGDAFAARSVGLIGVVCAGGTSTLLNASPAAAEQRRKVFAGKSLRFAFDPDEAGRAAVVKAARLALEAGAVRVAIIELPNEGQDLEDWLTSFETRDLALGALYQLMGNVTWEGAKELKAKEKEADQKDKLEFVQAARVHQVGDDLPTLVVMVWDEAARKASLAVFGPTQDLPPVVQQYGEGTPDIARGWRVLDSWSYNGTEYLPDLAGATQRYLENRTLVLPPPPPDEPMSSVDLWKAVRSFMQKWVAIPPAMYDVLVSYVFMSYRLMDGGFPYVPYLRFYGPPGSGKGRAIEVLGALCWRSYNSQPSAGNIHRIVEYFGDITLVFDEFHLDRGMSRETMQNLITVLNLGYRRGMGVTKIEESKGGRRIPKHFDLFGCKVFAGYGHDEEEGLARRTVNVGMGDVEVPAEMDLLALPAEFWTEAETLRGHLLAFRGRKLDRGMPDPRNPRAIALRDRAGSFVAQEFFPLVSMVPDSLQTELENVMRCAEGRRDATQQTRETSAESYLLETRAKVLDDGPVFPLKSRGGDGETVGTFITTEALYEAQDRWETPQIVAKRLQALGVPHGRRYVETGSNGEKAQRGGFLIRDGDAKLLDLMQRYGVDWPRKGPTGGAAL